LLQRSTRPARAGEKAVPTDFPTRKSFQGPKKYSSKFLSAIGQTKKRRQAYFCRRVSDMPISLTEVLLSPIECPRCVRYRVPMNLTSIVLGPGHSEERTFECAGCDLVETRTVADPLGSGEIRRAANNIGPSS